MECLFYLSLYLLPPLLVLLSILIRMMTTTLSTTNPVRRGLRYGPACWLTERNGPASGHSLQKQVSVMSMNLSAKLDDLQRGDRHMETTVALCEIRTQLQELTKSVESCQSEVSEVSVSLYYFPASSATGPVLSYPVWQSYAARFASFALLRMTPAATNLITTNMRGREEDEEEVEAGYFPF